MTCGGCGCGDYDDRKLRNLSRRYKNVWGYYPPSWDPCESCEKCIVKGYRKQLNKEKLNWLKDDCSACAHENCKEYIKWRRNNPRKNDKQNPWKNDCNRFVTRAEKVNKFKTR